MQFKNKTTGIVWDIENETHIKRCSNDPNYEKVEVKEKAKKEESSKESKPKTSQKKKSTSTKK